MNSRTPTQLQRLLDILDAQRGMWEADMTAWELGYRSGLQKAMNLIRDNWETPKSRNGDFG